MPLVIQEEKYKKIRARGIGIDFIICDLILENGRIVRGLCEILSDLSFEESKNRAKEAAVKRAIQDQLHKD